VATTRTVQSASLTAVAPGPFTADATGDKFAMPLSGPVFLRIINGGGSSITCTIDDPNSATPDSASAFNPDVVVTVAAGQSRVVKIAASNAERFTNAADSLVALAWSAVTSVTFELWQ
jgi:hypothetical protein